MLDLNQTTVARRIEALELKLWMGSRLTEAGRSLLSAAERRAALDGRAAEG